MARYLAALECELDVLGGLAWAPHVRVATVFFGGGTPSLLEPPALAAILARLRHRFAVAPDAEITVEGNPESVTRDKLQAYRAAGVNRLSLGVQSLEPATLRRLGRLHDARDARRAFEAARDAGLANVSVDLMYGLPGLDLADWSRTVHAVLDWQPDHLSAYGLTLDAESLWGATGVAGLPPEETVVAQYWRLARAAAERGFEHYEISNYARPGFRSRHNQIYWHAAEYLAAGPGACGFVGRIRYANVRATARYSATLEAGRLRLIDGDALDLDLTNVVPAPYEVVANLPYHITSPILHRLLGATPRPERLVLMVQREVAERIAAAPGGMSYLSVFVQYHARVRIAFEVPPEAFEPEPAVRSAVIVVEPYPADDRLPNREAEEALWRLVQASFRERRKMIHNVLSRQLPVEPAQVTAALETAGIAPDRRPQTVAVGEWLKLLDAFGEIGADRRGRRSGEDGA